MRLPVLPLKHAAETHPNSFSAKLYNAGRVDGEFLVIEDEKFDAIKTAHAKHPFGLGDLVSAVAQPIAKGIDAVAGTNIAGCGGCAKRREAMNKAVPNINPLKKP